MRGYTFHEHLEMVGLINMNGRVYDPILGRMLSPDNYVQAPDNTQSFNRYSYCWNNPLKYTDPSGDLIEAMFVGGLINVAIQGFSGNINNLGDLGKAFAVGAIAGAGGALVGGAVAGAIRTGGFIGGAITGAAGGATGGFIGGAGNSWMQGNSFKDGLTSGLKGAAIGAAGSALVGGTISGIKDFRNDFSFWDGSRTESMVIEGIDDITPNNFDNNFDFDKILNERMDAELGIKEGDYGIDDITTKASKGRHINGNGEYAKGSVREAGYTTIFSSGHSEIHIAPKYVNSDAITFRALAGHEVIHAYHNHLMPTSYVSAYSERVAYKYSYDTYMNAGRTNDALLTMKTAAANGYWLGNSPSTYRIPIF